MCCLQGKEGKGGGGGGGILRETKESKESDKERGERWVKRRKGKREGGVSTGQPDVFIQDGWDGFIKQGWSRKRSGSVLERKKKMFLAKEEEEEVQREKGEREGVMERCIIVSCQ